jgi:hypothetical protein
MEEVQGEPKATREAEGPPPVIYSNLVGVNITNDDMLLEFWEHRVGHATPLLPSEEVAKTKRPVLRVVVPFFAARFLRNFLNESLPKIEANRTKGE